MMRNPVLNRRKMLLGTSALGLSAVGLSACAGGPLRTPVKLFQLSPKSTFPDGLPETSRQLIIEQPTAAAGLRTPRIAVVRSRLRLEYFADANWIDDAPAMVQTLIVESFEATQKIVSVGRESIGLRADYQLKTELREFQAETTSDGGFQAHTRLNIKLVKMPQRTIVDASDFESVLPAKTNNIDDIIEAFDDALGSVLKRMVAWTMPRIV